MIVIAEKYGQLGNRLFVFAHFVASALEHGLKVSNPAFDEYAEFFETTGRDLFCRYPVRPSLLKGRRARRWLYTLVNRLANSLAYRSPRGRFWQVIRIEESESYDLSAPEFIAAAREKPFVFVQGWLFRDEPALRKHATALREFFAPAREVAERIGEHVRRAREGCELLVGVHVRQGDYRNFEGGRYFYESSEYARMMREAERLFPERRVGFLVCSNERQDPAVFNGHRHTPGPGHFVDDMYALAACDYIIGPPSTYTLWASFYGGAPLHPVEGPGASITLEGFRPYGSRGST
jgi:hypothetical protein